MPDEVVSTEAPAPVVETSVPEASASRQAVADQDFSQYETSRRAEDSGKPLPAPVPADEPTPPVPAPERQTSKKQQETNERIRQSVEAAQVADRAEIARLRAQLQPPPAPVPAPTKQAEFERYKAMPNAPKLEDFNDFQDWTIEMGSFITDQKINAKATTDSQIAYNARLQQDVQARLEAAKAEGIDTVALLKANMPIGPDMPGYKPVIEIARHSPLLVAFMQHFQEFPDEATRIAGLAENIAVIEMWRLEGVLHERSRLKKAAPVPQAKTLTSAPPPPETLGRAASETADPIRGAVERDDYGAYERARLAADAALRR